MKIELSMDDIEVIIDALAAMSIIHPILKRTDEVLDVKAKIEKQVGDKLMEHMKRKYPNYDHWFDLKGDTQ